MAEIEVRRELHWLLFAMYIELDEAGVQHSQHVVHITVADVWKKIEQMI